MSYTNVLARQFVGHKRGKIGVFMYYIGTNVIHKPFMHYVIQATLMYYIRFVE